ncbi:MAG TPA: hypothetical protein VMU26_27625 [Candidatus Polarisedimenticolia bacterium]|nr:hypothetical protein [Candidatus Polarisedimenticolia bacterium]
MNKTLLGILLLAVMTWPVWASAQQPRAINFPNGQCEAEFEQYLNDYRNATDDDQRASAKTSLAQLFDAKTQAGCVVSLILAVYPNQVRANLFLGFATVAEKQTGSASSTSGTTNLVSKNFTSRALSVANEYGALTSSTSGQTTTVSGSLDQLFTAIEHASKGTFVECAIKTIPGVFCVRSGALSFLGRLSYSASLDLNQPSTITGTAAGTAHGSTQQVTGTQGGNSFALSQFTSKFFIWAQKPSEKDFLNALNTQTESSDTPAARRDLVKIQNLADKDGAWQVWLTEALQALVSAPAQTVSTELSVQTKKLTTVLIAGGTPEQDLIKAALKYSASLAETAQAERAIYDKAAWDKPILTFEYDYNTPSNQPTNSTFRLILGKSTKSWKITGNVAGSIYNSTPSSSIPGSGRLRDIQFGVEGDHNPYALTNYLTATFSAAYYYQNQESPAILNVTPSSPISGISFTGLSSSATQVFTQKGTIHVGQLKLTLSGNSSSGWKFPIAITGSNRSELITKSTIGAQVGISYDFDSMFSGKSKQ